MNLLEIAGGVDLGVTRSKHERFEGVALANGADPHLPLSLA